MEKPQANIEVGYIARLSRNWIGLQISKFIGRLLRETKLPNKYRHKRKKFDMQIKREQKVENDEVEREQMRV